MYTPEIIDIIQTVLIAGLLYMVIKNSRPIVSKKQSKHSIVLDSCALIDGRIVDVAASGFVQSKIIVPNFIVSELQLLADGHDSHKRERARFGLDMVTALQNNSDLSVSISDKAVDSRLATDDKLVELAQQYKADLCTTDYNLNKVATIKGVRVLNVNELSNAVRPVALPGEKKFVKIVQKGSSRDQGVGYLEDGSMVVVEGAAKSIGKTIEAEVSRFIQTDAGKMLFAKIIRPTQEQTGKKKPSRKA